MMQRLLILMGCMSVTSCGVPAGMSEDVGSVAQGVVAPPAPAQGLGDRPFTLFESGQVRPLSLSPDGKTLYAVNTPDNRLEVFRVKPHGLDHRASVAVGLEPVAVAARDNDEVWVVNHLSDSVSVIDVKDLNHAHVRATLLVGDEPRDIVFGGPQHDRAFITTAHRGQNSPIDPELTTPGVGRADVWVFDAKDLGDTLGGTPLTILTLFGDTPRALSVTPDGARVYAAVFHSGNRTTTLHENLVPDGGEAHGGLPSPDTNFQGVPRPETGLIVKFNGSHWVDKLGRVWDQKVRFSLPDKDVFAIDAASDPPAAIAGPAGTMSGVGTVLFNMIVNPVSGKVYVSNTDALNDTRFEGPGVFGGSTVRGHIAESRITVLAGGAVTPRHLNKHIDYTSCCAPIPNDENAKSLAFPMGMAITGDGATLYVAAFGSSKIGVLSTAALEGDTFVPSTASQIPLSGGGPTGLVLDEARGRLYVLTRFDNSISIVSTASRQETAHLSMYNPEPESVVAGRRFLYDASFTSSHGDTACASCHVFGDFDSLAWDLGDPDGELLNMPGPFLLGPDFGGLPDTFHPMKGPMSTQSLRGLSNHGAMHWRGDRTGGNDAPSVQPDSGSFDEDTAFNRFNVAFPGLNGRSEEISAADMQAFTDFTLQITYPPNPIRALDGSLTPDQLAGRDIFMNPISDFFFNCNTCHVLDPGANPGDLAPGFFGTSGLFSFKGETQLFKVPHLRNMYQKVGMFGMAAVDPAEITGGIPFLNPRDHEPMGDQVRGFGFLHDGATDTMFRFFNAGGFTFAPPGVVTPDGNPGGFLFGTDGDERRRQVEEFMMVFDSNLAPIVGQQVTLTRTNAAVAGPRITLLRTRALLDECDLVVKGRVGGEEAGFLLTSGGLYARDRASEPPVTEAALVQLAQHPNQALTFTCVPPGSGVRIGLDRDSDGILDGDE